jgi:magnesium transporter
VVSVVLLPLTLLASVFGMNVGVPGEGDTAPFWVLVGVMIALGGGLLGVFRWKRWL